MRNAMGEVLWTEEASDAYEALRWTPGLEAAFEEVRARLRSLEASPAGHRVGAEQRRTERGTVWWVVVGPDRARWLLSWSELEPGVLVVESLDPLRSS